MECVLEPTRDAVRTRHAALAGTGVDLDLVLPAVAGAPFYNTSPSNLATLGSTSTRANLEEYLSRFSANARQIFEHFGFDNWLVKLEGANSSRRTSSRCRSSCPLERWPGCSPRSRPGCLRACARTEPRSKPTLAEPPPALHGPLAAFCFRVPEPSHLVERGPAAALAQAQAQASTGARDAACSSALAADSCAPMLGTCADSGTSATGTRSMLWIVRPSARSQQKSCRLFVGFLRAPERLRAQKVSFRSHSRPRHYWCGWQESNPRPLGS